ncbi:MAG: transcriptional repressor [Deltaproteobacteria bacterium]|nr:transcriptional repressor [Deltaproteobacteria bacterium]
MLVELRKAGLKLTPQRIAIVREIADDLSHPTAQSLFDRLRPAFPTMSFATVYNTLDALARCGLTGTLHLGGAVRFDPNTEPHDHAVCDACGVIIDLPAERPEGARSAAGAAIAAIASGFRISREQRTYRGLCGRCSDSN